MNVIPTGRQNYNSSCVRMIILQLEDYSLVRSFAEEEGLPFCVDMKQFWSLLAFLIFYVFYLLIGGCVFSAIECPAEIAAKNANGKEEQTR